MVRTNMQLAVVAALIVQATSLLTAQGASHSAPVPGPAPKPPGPFGDDFFMMTSTDTPLLTMLGEDTGAFALVVASRLQLVMGVPLTRFAVILPNPQATPQLPTLACVSAHAMKTAGPEAARYATADNTTYACGPASETMKISFLQSMRVATLGARSWNVGVFRPTGLDGDTLTSSEVQQKMAEANSGGTLPDRVLLPTGLWEMKPSVAWRMAAIFPGTIDSDTAMELGSNPGGWGAIATTPPPPGAPPPVGPAPVSEADYLSQAHATNMEVGAKFDKLVNYFRASSIGRYDALTGSPQTSLDTVVPNGALLPPWAAR